MQRGGRLPGRRCGRGGEQLPQGSAQCRQPKGPNSYVLCSIIYVLRPTPYTQDGTDYWLGGMDIDRNKGLQWLSGGGAKYTVLVDSSEPSSAVNP